MSLIKKHSYEGQPPLPQLRHTISDVTADRQVKHVGRPIDNIPEASESCSSEFFDLLGYGGFLAECDSPTKPAKEFSTELIQDRFIPNRKISHCRGSL